MEIFYKVRKNLYLCIGILLFILGQSAFAQTVVIQPNTLITVSKTYSDVDLDMRRGSFIVSNGATLKLENTTVNGSLSKNNPVLFNIDKGKLVITNSDVQIKAVGILPHPNSQSLYYVMQVGQGNVELKGSTYSIDQPFTAGMLITLISYGTNGFVIENNKISNFHGAIYLINTNNAKISNNVLWKNSYGNIVHMGNGGSITHNSIYFSGNNRLGNSIDILNSQNVNVSDNILLTPTCHAIYVLGSRKVTIDSNRVVGGITYAVNVLSFPESIAKDKFAYLSNIVPASKLNTDLSSDIVITNNFMSQNRYGVAVTDVKNLTVDKNWFIQRFSDQDARKFWTDNSVLLKNVTGLIWTNNLYKEAFTQDNNGDNSKSQNIVPFPVSGGITL